MKPELSFRCLACGAPPGERCRVVDDPAFAARRLLIPASRTTWSAPVRTHKERLVMARGRRAAPALLLAGLLLSLPGCVCGPREDMIDLLLTVHDSGWTCRDVGKSVEACRAQMRASLARVR